MLKSDNGDHTYFLHGALGNLYRISGQPKKAIDCLTFCLDQAVEEGSPAREVVSLIRLGEALKYESKHQEALNHFNQALELCEANKIEEYMDFGLQHKGKCLMELAMLDEAGRCLQKALEIRKSKGDPSLIDSTEQAINLVQEMKSK